MQLCRQKCHWFSMPTNCHLWDILYHGNYSHWRQPWCSRVLWCHHQDMPELIMLTKWSWPAIHPITCPDTQPFTIPHWAFLWCIQEIQPVFPNHTWHVSGQGTGDAVAQWIVQANSMIQVYQSCVQPSHSSIKLKIDQRVGAGLLESEFDWLSQIPYENKVVIISTDRLLEKSMMIPF